MRKEALSGGQQQQQHMYAYIIMLQSSDECSIIPNELSKKDD
jgi:hypothetical protein